MLLSLWPPWFSSYSFLLSSLAALGMAQKRFTGIFVQPLILYLLLLLPLSLLTGPHPLSIVCNLFLLPVIGIVLFPLAILSLISDLALSITEFFLEKLHALLAFVGGHTLPSETTSFEMSPWLWLYFLACYFFLTENPNYFSTQNQKKSYDLK